MYHRAYRTDLVTQPDGRNAGVHDDAGGRTVVWEQPDGTTFVGAFSLLYIIERGYSSAFLGRRGLLRSLKDVFHLFILQAHLLQLLL
jgi:hypothetical protein